MKSITSDICMVIFIEEYNTQIVLLLIRLHKCHIGLYVWYYNQKISDKVAKTNRTNIDTSDNIIYLSFNIENLSML